MSITPSGSYPSGYGFGGSKDLITKLTQEVENTMNFQGNPTGYAADNNLKKTNENIYRTAQEVYDYIQKNNKICGYANKLHNAYYKDKKMTIHSGLMVKTYNEHLRKTNPYAAPKSSHIYGKALDFDIDGISTDELRIKIVGQGFKGMKKSYSTWIHINLRPSQLGYANDW